MLRAGVRFTLFLPYFTLFLPFFKGFLVFLAGFLTGLGLNAFKPKFNAPLTPPTLPRPNFRTHVTLAARPAAERAGREGAGLARGMRAEVGALPRQGPRDPQGVGGGESSCGPALPPPPPVGFQPNRRWGGESSGKRKFCYKIATQREPGGWEKVLKKTQKKPKKLKKN